MCRIFLARNKGNATYKAAVAYLDEILPKITQETNLWMNGFGVSWYDATAAQWNLRKIAYPTRDAILNMILLTIKQAPKNAPIVCHIRIMILQNNLTQIKKIYDQSTRENAHPFLSVDGCIIAHTGLIKDFDRHRAHMTAQIAPHYRKYIRGETDTELILYMLVSAGAARDFPRAWRALQEFFHRHKLTTAITIVFGTPDGRTYYVCGETGKFEIYRPIGFFAAPRAAVVSSALLLHEQKPVVKKTIHLF